jgi:hypothetical protein
MSFESDDLDDVKEHLSKIATEALAEPPPSCEPPSSNDSPDVNTPHDLPEQLATSESEPAQPNPVVDQPLQLWGCGQIDSRMNIPRHHQSPVAYPNTASQGIYSHGGMTQPNEPMTPPSDDQPSQETTRNTKFDRVYGLILQLYHLIEIETNSLLLVENATGKALPATFAAISDNVTAHYRAQYKTDVPPKLIKDALALLRIEQKPINETVMFGRAGYFPIRLSRIINHGTSVFESTFGQAGFTNKIYPHITPTHSHPLPISQYQPHQPPNPTAIAPLFESNALPKEADLLVIAWMILCWMPDRSQVMLELLGRRSAEKAKAQQSIKELVDPSAEMLIRAVPKNVAALIQLAHQQYLLCFEHVTAVSDSMQTHLLSLMKGQIIPWHWNGKKTGVDIKVQRPILIGSSASIASDTSLKDATLSVVMDESQSQHPSLSSFCLGPLLDIFSHVQRRWSIAVLNYEFDRFGELRDLCRIGVLVAECLGREQTVFWQQLKECQGRQYEHKLDEKPIAQALLAYMESSEDIPVEHAAKNWLSELALHKPESCPEQDWPTTERKLGAEFDDIKGLMEHHGIRLTSIGKKCGYVHWQATKFDVENVDYPTVSEHVVSPYKDSIV